MQKKINVRRLLGRYYHLCEHYGNGNDYWVLYRNYRDPKVYYSKDNKPIMTSTKNTRKELEEFALKHHKIDSEYALNYILTFMLTIVLFIASILQLFNIDIGLYVLVVLITILLIYIINNFIIIHNREVDFRELSEIFGENFKDE